MNYAIKGDQARVDGIKGAGSPGGRNELLPYEIAAVGPFIGSR